MDTTAAPAAAKKRRPGKALAITGIVVTAAGWLTQHWTALMAYGNPARNVADAHGLCGSGPGILAQGSSAAAARACAGVGNWYTGTSVMIWGGLILAAAGVVIMLTKAKQA